MHLKKINVATFTVCVVTCKLIGDKICFITARNQEDESQKEISYRLNNTFKTIMHQQHNKTYYSFYSDCPWGKN